MKHYSKIDGLRFFAIGLVLIEHFASPIGKYFSAGYYGVDLFFVISGFLITTILLNVETPFWISYRNFIGRRTLRIFPIYYLSICVLLSLQLEPVKKYLFYIITYSYNYAWMFYNIQYNPISHFWSLCVEEQFYLFWPFVVLLLRKRPRILFSLVVLVISFGLIQIVFDFISSISRFNTINLITRMSSLGAGGLAALLHKTNRLPVRFLQSKMVEIGSFAILFFSLLIDFRFKYILFVYCSFYLVAKSVYEGFELSFVNKMLTNRFLAFVGTISYGIYIYHMPIGFYLDKWLFDAIWKNHSLINFFDCHHLGFIRIFRYEYSWLVKLPLYSCVSIVFAYVSFIYIEKPILGVKNKFFAYN